MTEVTILENDPLILEDDIITVYGKSQGNYKYTAVLGNEITIPYVKTLSYELQTID